MPSIAARIHGFLQSKLRPLFRAGQSLRLLVNRTGSWPIGGALRDPARHDATRLAVASARTPPILSRALHLPWGWNTGEFGPLEAKDGPDKSELHNADVEPICRKFLELRYQLLPYNYTLMRQ